MVVRGDGSGSGIERKCPTSPDSKKFLGISQHFTATV